MQSSAKTVDEYMKTVPVNRYSDLERIRSLCLNILKGFDESMMYGMPVYSRSSEPEISFNSQKNYISFYVLNTMAMRDFRSRLPKGTGKSCIRYTKMSDADFLLLEEILKSIVKVTPSSC